MFLLLFSFTECTQAGVLKLASSRTLPFWWDDVSDFNTLEALTVQTFNQVNIHVVLISFVFCGN